MRHADGVHVHVLHRLDVEPVDGFAQATARVRPERMAVRAFQNHAPAVHVEAVAVAHFHRAEAEALSIAVKDLIAALEADLDAVKVRRLGGPGVAVKESASSSVGFRAPGRRSWARERMVANRLAIERNDLRFERVGRCRRAVDEHIHRERAIGPRVNRHAFDELRRHGFEIDRPVRFRRTPSNPPLRSARLTDSLAECLSTVDLQSVRRAEFQQAASPRT